MLNIKLPESQQPKDNHNYKDMKLLHSWTYIEFHIKGDTYPHYKSKIFHLYNCFMNLLLPAGLRGLYPVKCTLEELFCNNGRNIL